MTTGSKVMIFLGILTVASVVGGPAARRIYREHPSGAQRLLAGEHQLVKTTATGGSRYFLAQDAGGKAYVNFAWEGNDGKTVDARLPRDKIAVDFDPSAAVPIVRFKWRSSGLLPMTPDKAMSDYVLQAVIRMSKDDWIE